MSLRGHRRLTGAGSLLPPVYSEAWTKGIPRTTFSSLRDAAHGKHAGWLTNGVSRKKKVKQHNQNPVMLMLSMDTFIRTLLLCKWCKEHDREFYLAWHALSPDLNPNEDLNIRQAGSCLKRAERLFYDWFTVGEENDSLAAQRMYMRQSKEPVQYGRKALRVKKSKLKFCY
ncbi:hypothetical protein TNCV_4492551 [Trichonephila clavipes]|nr:hypothetical protein TNCV_4492551 [Trichonephila clavipes]